MFRYVNALIDFNNSETLKEAAFVLYYSYFIQHDVVVCK